MECSLCVKVNGNIGGAMILYRFDQIQTLDQRATDVFSLNVILVRTFAPIYHLTSPSASELATTNSLAPHFANPAKSKNTNFEPIRAKVFRVFSYKEPIPTPILPLSKAPPQPPPQPPQ